MRKSRYVSTLLMGATALGVSACGEEPQPTEVKIFPSVEACAADFSEEQCRQALQQSSQLHWQTAPRFESEAACEQQMGDDACQQVAAANPDGSVGSVFVPGLMGFMLGRALTSGAGYYARPVFIDRDGFARTGSARIGRFPGGRQALSTRSTGTTVATTVTRSGEIGTRTTRRGGFGRTSSRFGGGG